MEARNSITLLLKVVKK